MSNDRYTFEKMGDGPIMLLEGPGIRNKASARISCDEDAARQMTYLLERAYEAGREARAEEIRTALGIHNTPWGIKVLP